MPWCRCRKTPTIVCDPETCITGSSSSTISSCEDLEKMKQSLMRKEIELMKKCQKLNKKVKNFEKCRKQKELNDRQTEEKLKLAHKRIEQAIGKKCGCRKNSNKKKDSKKPKQKKKSDFHDKLHKFLTNCYEKPILCSLDTCQHKKCYSMGKHTDSFFSRCFYNPWAYQGSGSCRNPFSMSCPCKCGNWKQINSNMEKKRAMRSAAGDCFLMSLRETPQLWIYDRWPGLYSPYLSMRSQYRSLGRCCLFLLAALFWTPCLLCLALCKCCFCTCCHDGC